MVLRSFFCPSLMKCVGTKLELLQRLKNLSSDQEEPFHSTALTLSVELTKRVA
jgi:hypothetical protein